MKKLTFIILLLTGLLFLFPVTPILAQESTTIIITRHAERLDDSTDPPLSDAGNQRALRLADHLERTEITAVYSTPYRRTQETVKILADRKGLEIGIFESFTDEILSSLLEKYNGGTVLIAGHSNTVPHLVNALIGEKRFEDFDKLEYDNLFIITLHKMGTGKMVHLVY